MGGRPRDRRLRGLSETRIRRATKTRSKTSPYRQRDLKPRKPARQQAAMTRPRQTAAPTGRGAPASTRGRGRCAQELGVWMLGAVEGRRRGPPLDHNTALHDDGRVGDLADDTEVVADHHVADPASRRGCRRAGSGSGPGSRRRGRRPPRPAAGRAARPRGRARSRLAGAGRRRAPAAARSSADRPGRPARRAPRPGARLARSERKCSRSTSSIDEAGVCRGSSELYGSWKTICVSRPRRRRSDARPRGAAAVAPGERDPPRGRPLEAHEHARQRRLAGAGLADDRQRLALRER